MRPTIKQIEFLSNSESGSLIVSGFEDRADFFIKVESSGFDKSLTLTECSSAAELFKRLDEWRDMFSDMKDKVRKEFKEVIDAEDDA